MQWGVVAQGDVCGCIWIFVACICLLVPGGTSSQYWLVLQHLVNQARRFQHLVNQARRFQVVLVLAGQKLVIHTWRPYWGHRPVTHKKQGAPHRTCRFRGRPTVEERGARRDPEARRDASRCCTSCDRSSASMCERSPPSRISVEKTG